MAEKNSSKPEIQSAGEQSSPVESSAKKSKKHIVATCTVCKGETAEGYPVSTESDAMALCVHNDGCPGGHDDRKFKFS